MLEAKDIEVSVAKADVSRDKDISKTSLGDRYQLQKLPTLMFFVADGIVKYQGIFPKNVVPNQFHAAHVVQIQALFLCHMKINSQNNFTSETVKIIHVRSNSKFQIKSFLHDFIFLSLI